MSFSNDSRIIPFECWINWLFGRWLIKYEAKQWIICHKIYQPLEFWNAVWMWWWNVLSWHNEILKNAVPTSWQLKLSRKKGSTQMFEEHIQKKSVFGVGFFFAFHRFNLNGIFWLRNSEFNGYSHCALQSHYQVLEALNILISLFFATHKSLA